MTRGPRLESAYDAVVVGSGASGLAASVALAQRGLRVLCLEQHSVPGGCATRFHRGPPRARFHFDVGLHYVGEGGPEGGFASVLRTLGIELTQNRLDPDAYDVLHLGAHTVRVPASIEGFVARLAERCPEDSAALATLQADLEGIAAALPARRAPGGTAPPPPDLRVSSLTLRQLELTRLTALEYLDALPLRAPLARAALLAYCALFGAQPTQASALFLLGVWVHYLDAPFYPEGGGQVLSDALVERFEALGGTLALRSPVERVLSQRRGVQGVRVRVEGALREVSARAVLLASDPRAALGAMLEPSHLPSEERLRLQRSRPSAGMHLTFLGLRGEPEELGIGQRNYWVCEGVRESELWWRGADGGLRTAGALLTSGSSKDPRARAHHAPPGHTALEVLQVVPADFAEWGAEGVVPGAKGYRSEERYLERKRQLEELALERVRRLVPDVESRLVLRESATPPTHARYLWTAGGAAYGLAMSVPQSGRARVPYESALRGLYFCGASCAEGPGVLGCIVGGRDAASLLARHLER